MIWLCIRGGIVVLLALAASAQDRSAVGLPPKARTPLREIPAASGPAQPLEAWELSESSEVRALYEKAQAALADGRVAEAREQLLQAARQCDGRSYDVNYLLAVAGARQGLFGEAATAAERALALRPDAADPHVLLGDAYARLELTEQAVRHYRSATLRAEREASNANVTLAWYRLGEVLARDGHLLAAVEAFGEFDTAVWETHPEHRNAEPIEALLRAQPHGALERILALQARLGESEQRVAAADAGRRRWPDDPGVARQYAEALLDAGRAPEAFEFCQARLAEGRWDEPLLDAAIRAAQAAGRVEAWVDGLTRQTETARGLALVRAAARRMSLTALAAPAARLGEAVLAQHPDDFEAAWVVAEARRAAGDWRGGIEALIRLVRSNPAREEFPQERLLEWTKAEEARRVLPPLVAELRAGPERDFASDFVLGVLAAALEQKELGDKLLAASVAARPDFAPALLARAKLDLARGDWESAKRRAQEILQQRPQVAAAHFALAQALDGLDENEQAEQEYRKAERLQPNEAGYALKLALHLRRTGVLLGAARYFQQALAVDPCNGEALEGLVESYLRAGKVDLARAQFERIDATRIPADSLRRVQTLLRFADKLFGDEHLEELLRQVDGHPGDLATARLLAGGLIARGKLEQAWEVLRPQVAAHPDDYHTASLLAHVHLRRAEFEDGLRVLERLRARYPNRREVLEPLSSAYLYEFRAAEALQVLGQLLERGGGEFKEFHQDLLKDCVRIGETDAALAFLDQWLDRGKQRQELIELKLSLLQAAKRNEQILALLEQQLAAAPDDPQARNVFVQIAPEFGGAEAAERRLREWLKQPAEAGGADPLHRAELTEDLIELLLRQKRSSEALQLAREYEPHSPSEAHARRAWLAWCQIAVGDVDDGLAELDALRGEAALTAELRQTVDEWTVRFLQTFEHVDRAVQRLEGQLSETSDDRRRVQLRARILDLLTKVGRGAEAGQRCQRWLSEEKNPAVTQLLRRMLVTTLIDGQQYDEALRECDAWLRESESRGELPAVETLELKGAVLQAAGRDAEYAALMERLLPYARDDAGFNNNLGYTWVDLGMNLEQATRMIRKAVAAKPLWGTYLDSLGWAHYKAGDFAAARKQLERAIRTEDGRDAVIFDHLADAAWRLGDRPTSEEYWTQALKLLEAKDAGERRPPEVELLGVLRGKLEALQRGQPPTVAPTAAEQHPTAGEGGK